MNSNTAKEDLGKPPTGPSKSKIHKLRDELKRDVERMQKMLTNREQSFLESIVTSGTEMEVQTALQRLNDISLFFHQHDDDDDDGDDDQNHQPTGDEETMRSIPVGNGIQGHVDNPQQAIQFHSLNSQQSSASSCSGTGMNRRSSKVLEALEVRKASEIHGQIWRAHETGQSVSILTSRKSNLRRVSNLTREQILRNNSFLSSSTRNLLLEGGFSRSQGSDLIFREHFNSSFDEQRRGVDSLSPLAPKSILRPSDLLSPIALTKVKSDGIRRSVSFQKTAGLHGSQSYLSTISPRSTKGSMLRDVSDLTLGSDWHSRPDASLSTTQQENDPPSQKLGGKKFGSGHSFPYIHKAHPIKSESVVESIVSVPSLHRALPLRSESFASTQDTKPSDSILPSGLVTNDEDPVRNQTAPSVGKPLLLRMASRNSYHGEGFEVTEINDDMENLNRARLFSSLLSNGEISTVGSWDETTGRENIFRNHRRSTSDDGVLPLYLIENNSMYEPSHVDNNI
jgi:hypothetical protein